MFNKEDRGESQSFQGKVDAGPELVGLGTGVAEAVDQGQAPIRGELLVEGGAGHPEHQPGRGQ